MKILVTITIHKVQDLILHIHTTVGWKLVAKKDLAISLVTYDSFYFAVDDEFIDVEDELDDDNISIA